MQHPVPSAEQAQWLTASGVRDVELAFADVTGFAREIGRAHV